MSTTADGSLRTQPVDITSRHNQDITKTQKVQCGTSTSVCARLKAFFLVFERFATGQKMRCSVEANLEVDNARSLHKGSRHIFDSKDIVGKAQGMTSEGARFLLSNWRLPPPANYKVEVAYR